MSKLSLLFYKSKQTKKKPYTTLEFVHFIKLLGSRKDKY